MSCGAKGPLSLDFAGKVTVEGMRNSKGHKICPSTRLYTVVHKKSLSLQYPHSLPTYTSYTTAYWQVHANKFGHHQTSDHKHQAVDEYDLFYYFV